MQQTNGLVIINQDKLFLGRKNRITSDVADFLDRLKHKDAHFFSLASGLAECVTESFAITKTMSLILLKLFSIPFPTCGFKNFPLHEYHFDKLLKEYGHWSRQTHTRCCNHVLGFEVTALCTPTNTAGPKTDFKLFLQSARVYNLWEWGNILTRLRKHCVNWPHSGLVCAQWPQSMTHKILCEQLFVDYLATMKHDSLLSKLCREAKQNFQLPLVLQEGAGHSAQLRLDIAGKLHGISWRCCHDCETIEKNFTLTQFFYSSGGCKCIIEAIRSWFFCTTVLFIHHFAKSERLEIEGRAIKLEYESLSRVSNKS